MKRDMELIRKILFYIEDNCVPSKNLIKKPIIVGYDKHLIVGHAKLLEDEGLIRKLNRNNFPLGLGNLTSKGHNYLELIRNDDVWEKTNNEINKKNYHRRLKTLLKWREYLWAIY